MILVNFWPLYKNTQNPYEKNIVCMRSKQEKSLKWYEEKSVRIPSRCTLCILKLIEGTLWNNFFFPLFCAFIHLLLLFFYMGENQFSLLVLAKFKQVHKFLCSASFISSRAIFLNIYLYFKVSFLKSCNLTIC